MWLYSEIRTLGDIPRHYGSTVPDRPALIDGRGPVSWSELDRRSNQVAQVMAEPRHRTRGSGGPR